MSLTKAQSPLRKARSAGRDWSLLVDRLIGDLSEAIGIPSARNGSVHMLTKGCGVGVGQRQGGTVRQLCTQAASGNNRAAAPQRRSAQANLNWNPRASRQAWQ